MAVTLLEAARATSDAIRKTDAAVALLGEAAGLAAGVADSGYALETITYALRQLADAQATATSASINLGYAL